MSAKKIFKYAAMFFTGGVGYIIIEILWRGNSRWSMGAAGGFCFCALYRLSGVMKGIKIFFRCVAGSGIITFTELCFGIVLNKKLRLKVWDYSANRFNFKGLICPLYSFLWGLLCIPVFACFDAADRAKLRLRRLRSAPLQEPLIPQENKDSSAR